MFFVFACQLLRCSSAGAALSSAEHKEIESRLKNFYQIPVKPEVMDRAFSRFNAITGEIESPNTQLLWKGQISPDALLQQAQAKSTKAYQADRCKNFLNPKFPQLKCGGEHKLWETAKAHDQVKDLATTWIAPAQVAYSLDEVPVTGEVQNKYWSGDYWSMRLGLTSHRYSDATYYSDYKTAVASYVQPAEWEKLLSPLDLEQIARHVLDWSPSEKYDLLAGDESFALTNQQKNEGANYLGEDGNVESWFGICHGWAPASVFVPPPLHPVDSVGARGVKVRWYPDDIRAIVTLAWANGNFRSNFIGGRCNAKKIERYENGRINQPECFDNNPATFHLALGNMIGREKVPFVMDAAYDYTVWNQPVVKYEFEYFNPLNENERSKKWQEVSVAYDSKFKKKDRFQKPKTRGVKRETENYDDSGIEEVVGVIASVTYLGETGARHTEEPRENHEIRVSYIYDLELHEKEGKLVPLGGEWHENTHPDFLWAPQRDSLAQTYHDLAAPKLDLKVGPTDGLSKLSKTASEDGYPLCNVISPLIEASAEEGATYPCR